MKIVKTNIVTLLILTMYLIIFNNKYVFAQEEKIDDGVIYETEDGYEYVYTPDKECWDELGTNMDMINALQIPTETLNNLSTEDIIKLITKYPLLNNIYHFDTLYDGYIELKNNFQAIDYVLQRDDCFEELLKIFQNHEIPEKRILDLSSFSLLDEEEYIEAINAFASDRKNAKIIMEDAFVVSSIDILELMLHELIDSDDDFYKFILAYKQVLPRKIQSEYYDDKNANIVLNLMADIYPFNYNTINYNNSLWYKCFMYIQYHYEIRYIK